MMGYILAMGLASGDYTQVLKSASRRRSASSRIESKNRDVYNHQLASIDTSPVQPSHGSLRLTFD